MSDRLRYDASREDGSGRMKEGNPGARDAFSALSAGDLPGISMVLIDGKITIGRSRNTPPAARAAEVIKGHGPVGGAH